MGTETPIVGAGESSPSNCWLGWVRVNTLDELRSWESENYIGGQASEPIMFPVLVRPEISGDEYTFTEVMDIQDVKKLFGILYQPNAPAHAEGRSEAEDR